MGTSVETMAFVRAGGKTIPYRKHEYTEEYCQRYGYPCHYQSQGEEIVEVKEARQANPDLINELQAQKAKKSTLEIELEKLKADYAALNNKNISDWEHNELSQDFAFGSRYYECLSHLLVWATATLLPSQTRTTRTPVRNLHKSSRLTPSCKALPHALSDLKPPGYGCHSRTHRAKGNASNTWVRLARLTLKQ